MTFEVIVNPAANIATALILLLSITAITFIAILLLCGVRTEDTDIDSARTP